MTLLVEDIRFNNIYTENYGVVEEETIMFFFSGFLVPLLWLINPWAIYSKIRQWYYYGRPDFTQGEANEIM